MRVRVRGDESGGRGVRLVYTVPRPVLQKAWKRGCGVVGVCG